MRIDGQFFKAIPLFLGASFAPLVTEAQPFRPAADTNALHAPQKDIFVNISPAVQNLVNSFISEFNDLSRSFGSFFISEQSKIEWLKKAIPLANQFSIKAEKQLPADRDKNLCHQFFVERLAKQLGFPSIKSEGFNLAMSEAGYMLSPTFSFYDSKNPDAPFNREGVEFKPFLALEDKPFMQIQLKDYPAVTELFGNLISTNMPSRFAAYIADIKDKSCFTDRWVATTIPTPNSGSVVVFNPYHRNDSVMLRKAAENELGHVYFNLCFPKVNQFIGSVIKVDDFRANTLNLEEFISDALNVIGGDDFDIARLIYFASRPKKTEYAALSSHITDGILASLVDKYGFKQGFPVCSSIKETQEVCAAMLKAQNPTKPNVVKDFYADFKSAFVPVAKDIVKSVKAADDRLRYRPGIIGK